MKLLLQAIPLLYSIGVVMAGSSLVESVIRHNSMTLMGAAINNDVGRIRKLLKGKEMDEGAAEEVVQALDQAKWHGKSEANRLLTEWLKQAKASGVKVPQGEKMIVPRSLLGSKCLCEYLGDDYAVGSHGWGSGVHGEDSIDRELEVGVISDDYRGVRETLRGLRVTSSNIRAVKRAVQKAEHLDSSRSLKELNAWLKKAQSPDPTMTDDEQSRFGDGGDSGDTPDSNASRRRAHNIDQGGTKGRSAPPNSDEQSIRSTGPLDESATPSADTPIDHPIRSTNKDPVGARSDSGHLHTPPASSTKPLKSILKPSKAVPAQLSPGWQEALRDIVLCPHCGGPMTQAKHRDTDDVTDPSDSSPSDKFIRVGSLCSFSPEQLHRTAGRHCRNQANHPPHFSHVSYPNYRPQRHKAYQHHPRVILPLPLHNTPPEVLPHPSRH